MILMNLDARKWIEKVKLPEKEVVWIRLDFEKFYCAKSSRFFSAPKGNFTPQRIQIV